MPTTAVATEVFGGASGSAWPAGFTTVSGTTTQQAGRGQLDPGAGAGAAAAVVWDGPAVLADVEVLADFAFVTAAAEQYAILAVRAPGTASPTPGIPSSGYYVEVNPQASTVRLMRSEGATQVELWNMGSFTWGDNVPGTIRFRAENVIGGVVLSVRMWPGSSEPAGWITTTDTDPTQIRTAGDAWFAVRNGSAATARIGSVGDLLLSSLTPDSAGAKADTLVLPQLAVSAPATPAAGESKVYATTAGLRTKLPAGTDAAIYPAVSPGAPTVANFTASGTWTKPANAKWVEIICIGGGGGGGGGSNNGGAGGGGATKGRVVVPASALGATEAVTVGAGGVAGTASASAQGNPGAKGGDSTFGTTTTVCAGRGGFGGKANQIAPGGSNGGPGGGVYGYGGAGISAQVNAFGGAAQDLLPPDFGPGGGGAPGWFTNNAGNYGLYNRFEPVAQSGFGAASGGAGPNGTSQTLNKPAFGNGGGGGGSLINGTGGKGGNGGNYGAGGGGGGGGATGGVGGTGGPGIVVVISYFS